MEALGDMLFLLIVGMGMLIFLLVGAVFCFYQAFRAYTVIQTTAEEDIGTRKGPKP